MLMIQITDNVNDMDCYLAEEKRLDESITLLQPPAGFHK